MSNFKEIVTKAIIGKAKKITHGEYRLRTEEKADTVLGCWVINHSFTGNNNNGKVEINGSFDINVWYSYDLDTKTKVGTQRYSYTDVLPISIKDNGTIDNNSEIIVRSLRQPTVSDVKIIDGEVVMNVEKELGVEVVGDTKIKVNVEDDEDDYEIISEENIENNIDELKDDFLDS